MTLVWRILATPPPNFRDNPPLSGGNPWIGGGAMRGGFIVTVLILIVTHPILVTEKGRDTTAAAVTVVARQFNLQTKLTASCHLATFDEYYQKEFLKSAVPFNSKCLKQLIQLLPSNLDLRVAHV
jgi:hypothetical protein